MFSKTVPAISPSYQLFSTPWKPASTPTTGLALEYFLFRRDRFAGGAKLNFRPFVDISEKSIRAREAVCRVQEPSFE